MNPRILAISSSLVFVATLALPAAAATLTGATYGSTGVSVGTSGTATSTAPMGSGTNVSGNVGASVATGPSAGASASVQSNTNANANANSNPNMAVTGGTVLLINSDPLVVNFSGSTTPTVSDAVSVQTQPQLSMYAAGMMHADTNLQSVQLTSNNISISYTKQGMLFGFIPMSITEQASADANGNVTVSYPWYHFLVSTNDDANLQSNLQAQIQPLVKNANGSLSAQTQAQVMADLYAGLSGK